MYENIIRDKGGLTLRSKNEDSGPYQLVQGGENGMVVATLGKEGSGVEHPGTWLQKEARRMAEVTWIVATDLSEHPLVKDVREILKIVKRAALRWRGKIVYPDFTDHVRQEAVRLMIVRG